MCDEPFPAAVLLPAVVVGHNLTATTREMSDVDLDHDVGATYIIQVLQFSPNDLTHPNKLTVTNKVKKFPLLLYPILYNCVHKTHHCNLLQIHNFICFFTYYSSDKSLKLFN